MSIRNFVDFKSYISPTNYKVIANILSTRIKNIVIKLYELDISDLGDLDMEPHYESFFEEVENLTGQIKKGRTADKYKNLVKNWGKLKGGSKVLAVETYYYLHTISDGKKLANYIDGVIFNGKTFLKANNIQVPGGYGYIEENSEKYRQVAESMLSQEYSRVKIQDIILSNPFNVILSEMASNIHEINSIYTTFDFDDLFIDLNDILRSGNIVEFVDVFYKFVACNIPSEMLYLVELLWRDAGTEDPNAWQNSNGNYIAIAISMCLCKNLRVICNIASEEGILSEEIVCRYSKYVRVTFISIIEFGRLYAKYNQDDAEIMSKISIYEKYIRDLLIFRKEIVSEYSVWKGGIYLEAILGCENLSELWCASKRIHIL